MRLPTAILSLRAPLRPAQSNHRRLYTSISTMATKHDIKYSSNSDPEKVAAEVTRLTNGQGRWNISATKSGVEREFKFKTFKTTWAFMNTVAEEAGKKKHHPEWSNVYNTTFIRWTTHHPAGLSQLDVDLAAFCDKQAAKMGELVPEAAHQSIQERLTESERVEASAAAAQAEGKTPGEAMKDQIEQSEAEARGEDAGGMVTLVGGSPERGELESEESSMSGLTDRAVKAGEDCCVPKSAKTSEDKESEVKKVASEELHNKGP